MFVPDEGLRIVPQKTGPANPLTPQRRAPGDPRPVRVRLGAPTPMPAAVTLRTVCCGAGPGALSWTQQARLEPALRSPMDSSPTLQDFVLNLIYDPAAQIGRAHV